MGVVNWDVWALNEGALEVQGVIWAAGGGRSGEEFFFIRIPENVLHGFQSLRRRVSATTAARG